MGRTLFIIDMQNDFIDQNDAALPVPGGFHNVVNTSILIGTKGDYFHKIVVALDQHPLNHIAHAIMWQDVQGNHPAPFTTITAQDVDDGTWMASNERNRRIQHDYVRDVEGVGSSLTIWPEHCIIGSWGASLHPRLCHDLRHWSRPDRLVQFFPKSGNWSTEQYSSFRAIVPRYEDTSTLWNRRMYEAVKDDEIYISGLALSHCVAESLRDAFHHRPEDELARRMTILLDCTSSVSGCEEMADEFLNEFVMAGGRVKLTKDVF